MQYLEKSYFFSVEIREQFFYNFYYILDTQFQPGLHDHLSPCRVISRTSSIFDTIRKLFCHILKKASQIGFENVKLPYTFLYYSRKTKNFHRLIV